MSTDSHTHKFIHEDVREDFESKFKYTLDEETIKVLGEIIRELVMVDLATNNLSIIPGKTLGIQRS